MKKFQSLNKQKNSKTRQPHMTSLTKTIIWIFLGIGTLALFASIVYVSSILVLVSFDSELQMEEMLLRLG